MSDDLVNATKLVMAVMKKYMMLPYYCELFNVVIDIQGAGVFTSTAPIRAVIAYINANFKNELNKLMIINLSGATSM